MTHHPLFKHDPAEVGEMIYAQVMSEDSGNFDDIGEDLQATYAACTTDAEREILNRTLIALCGWGLTSLNNLLEGKAPL